MHTSRPLEASSSFSKDTCHRGSPAPPISPRCARSWTVFHWGISVRKQGDMQLLSHIVLSAEFSGCFRDFYGMEKDISLFSSPFSAPHQLQLELIELQCDNELRGRQQQLSLTDFHRQLEKGRFPEMRTFAKRMLSLFGSTYLCEQTFCYELEQEPLEVQTN